MWPVFASYSCAPYIPLPFHLVGFRRVSAVASAASDDAFVADPAPLTAEVLDLLPTSEVLASSPNLVSPYVCLRLVLP